MYIAGTDSVHVQAVLLVVWVANTRRVSTDTALINVHAVLAMVYFGKYTPLPSPRSSCTDHVALQ